MADFDFVTLAAPVAREKLGDETAVALLGTGLGAQKRDSRRPGGRVQARGNAAFLHDGEKTCFIRGPISGTAITLEEFRRRCEQQFVRISNLADFLEEEREIGMLGKARKLTVAVLPVKPMVQRRRCMTIRNTRSLRKSRGRRIPRTGERGHPEARRRGQRQRAKCW